MREAIKESGRHLGIAEVEVGRDDDGSSLAKAADEMEEELSTGLREREVDQLIKDWTCHGFVPLQVLV